MVQKSSLEIFIVREHASYQWGLLQGQMQHMVEVLEDLGSLSESLVCLCDLSSSLRQVGPWSHAQTPKDLLNVDEVLQVLLHTHQLAIVDCVSSIYQCDFLLVHFANIKVLQR